MAFIVMAYVVMAYEVMAHAVMAYDVMAHVVIALIVMAYIVLNLYSYGPGDGLLKRAIGSFAAKVKQCSFASVVVYKEQRELP